MNPQPATRIAIACGGTGGHLFPGLAVAGQLARCGCAVTLLISPKEVDQQAVKLEAERRFPNRRDSNLHSSPRSELESGAQMEVVTLPAVGLQNRNYFSFGRSFLKSYLAARREFRRRPVSAVLAMGGFTSAPPVLAGKRLGARTFLHESNSIPGRANRWLSSRVDQAFIGFPQTARRLRSRNNTVTGTPVRSQFKPMDAAACREKLGLDPANPVLLVTGGSQGASGINQLIIRALPILVQALPQLQLIHFTGPNDADQVRQAADVARMRAFVQPFFSDMEFALGAADVAVSRAGASSLAELAAMRVPPVLIPYPAATDDHQLHNARAFEETGAAKILRQIHATPEALLGLLQEIFGRTEVRISIQDALSKWHTPNAAAEIAGHILRAVGRTADETKNLDVSDSESISDAPRQTTFSAA